MNSHTIKKLNDLNRQFYSKIEQSWDQTRSYSWPGWGILLQRLNLNSDQALEILDVGSGNGRFVKFLQESSLNFNYLGLDFNEELMKISEERYNAPNIKFQSHDILTPLDLGKKFDLIALFGVIHHIPAYQNRVNLLKSLKAHLKPGGTIALAIWKFNEFDSLKQKIVSPEIANINPQELEENDFILDWKKETVAYRYAHYIDSLEETQLIKDSGLNLIDEFRADGKQKTVNQYLLLQ